MDFEIELGTNRTNVIAKLLSSIPPISPIHYLSSQSTSPPCSPPPFSPTIHPSQHISPSHILKQTKQREIHLALPRLALTGERSITMERGRGGGWVMCRLADKTQTEVVSEEKHNQAAASIISLS